MKKIKLSYVEDEIENFASEHAEAFRKFSDLEGIIIRGHILVEQAINKAIEFSLVDQKEYFPDKFSFNQKVQIGNILGITKDFKKELNVLNKLRNQIAHSLKYEDKYIKEIIEGAKKKGAKVEFNNTNESYDLGFSISFICGWITYCGEYKARLNFTTRMIEEATNSKKRPKLGQESTNKK